MKTKFTKISFNKEFFAKLLQTRKDDLRYVFLVYKCDDDEETFRIPAIAVKGINEWVYNLEMSHFTRLTSNHLIEKAQVKKTKNEVIFLSATGETEVIKLADFYRYYMTKVANVWLL